MNISPQLRIPSCLLVVLPAVFALGCDGYWGCDADATCPSTTAGNGLGGTDTQGSGSEDPCPDDPADGSVDESCGIWVSSSLGDDKNPGTQGRPVKTLAKGIALASTTLAGGGRGRLYACGETFAEAVTLAPGVSLFGGFACAEGWTYSGKEEKRTVVAAPPALAALVLPEAGDVVSTIMDVDVHASDAQDPGASSIGAFAAMGAKAALQRVSIFAGNGADGADGADGAHGGGPAKNGATGNDGEDACSADIGLGGVAAITQCEDGTIPTGGPGGDGGEAAASSGLEGSPAPNPNPQSFGAAGAGQDAAQMTLCTGGINGAHGKSGNNGSGGKGLGTLDGNGFHGVSGEDGSNGLPGQGGGGGGAALGGLTCGAAPHGGAGGGSGGAGGCGGSGGKGGQPGGASIGLVVLGAGVRADASVTIWAGNGGNGGNGGVAQLGGQGGLPGYGGFGSGGQAGALNACAGGVGGAGGPGGDGGGGTGGPSIGIAFKRDFPLAQGITAVPTFGNGGSGGLGGSPDSYFQAGAGGVPFTTEAFP